MSSIRRYLNPEQQLDLLANEKKLVFVDKESKDIFLEYLKLYGYYSLIKKTYHPLMFKIDSKNPTSKIYKEEFSSNNLRYLFDIDRNISTIIYKYFRSIEFLINTSLSKVLSKKINELTKCPYIAAISEKDFDIIFSNINKKIATSKKRNNNLVLNVFLELFKNYRQDDISLEEIAKENRDRENVLILDKIKKGWLFNSIKNSRNYNIKHYGSWELIDIYSIMETLNFQQLYRITSYLSKSLKNELMHQCISKVNKKNKLVAEDFELLLLILSKVRNLFSHNGFLLAFNFQSDERTIKSLNAIIKFFNLDVRDQTLKLNDIILIMEKLIGIESKIINEVYCSIETKLVNRTQRQDKISCLLFDIIHDFSSIKINDEIKNKII